MSLAQHEIAHMVFSTAAANPQSGTEMGREIVASSPGVPEGMERVFSRLADMTGPALRRPDLPPLWAFRRVSEEHWLALRGVSLGTYRGGTHRLLVHGLVLARQQVDLLDGNPLLLAAPGARAAGLHLIEHHPDGRRELPPLTLDPAFEGTARRLDHERFLRGSERFAPLDEGFPLLYDAIRDRSRPTGCVLADAPDPAFLEWLLLHFHPADRAELSFHTAYAYEQETAFDLLGLSPDGASEIRRQFRELELWRSEAAPTTASPLAQRVVELRRRDPSRYGEVLEEYYLDLLPSRFDRDLRRQPFQPLSDAQADLCLRAALGHPLGAEEQREQERLALRGATPLMRHSARLAEAWDEGIEPFTSLLARYRSAPPAVDRADLDRLHPPPGDTQRLALLALLGVLTSEAGPVGGAEDGTERRRQLWPRVVRDGDLDGVLDLLRDPAAGEVGEAVLAPWIEAVAAGEIRIGQHAAWPAWLAWLARSGRPVAPAAARLEQRIEEAPPDAALGAYRRLAKACLDAGLDAFALRLLFQREVPRLPPPAAAVRIGDGVRWLLAGDGAADAFLAPYLAAPESAAAVFSGLEEPLAAGGAPAGGPAPAGSAADPAREASWPRLRTFLAAQPSPALSVASAPAAGAFLGRLALSPLAEHTAEAFDLLAALAPPGAAAQVPSRLLGAAASRVLAGIERERPPRRQLARGVSGLLAARNALSGAEEPAEAVDAAFLELLPPTLASTPAAGAGAGLRAHFDLYLDHLLRLRRLPRLIPAGTAWRHLLLDELLAAPSTAPEDDPRVRLCLLLAWRRWSEQRPAASGARPADLAVLRLARHAPSAALERVREVVPSRLRGEAEGLLQDSLFGAS